MRHSLTLTLPTEDDFTFPHAARRRAEDILVERKATYFIQIFGGARHGYATRADPEVKTERECVYQSMERGLSLHVWACLS